MLETMVGCLWTSCQLLMCIVLVHLRDVHAVRSDFPSSRVLEQACNAAGRSRVTACFYLPTLSVARLGNHASGSCSRFAFKGWDNYEAASLLIP